MAVARVGEAERRVKAAGRLIELRGDDRARAGHALDPGDERVAVDVAADREPVAGVRRPVRGR